LIPYDIAGSIAHAQMLGRQRIISEREADQIVGGLEGIAQDYAEGAFSLEQSLEDVHMNVEAALTKRIGAVAGKLHTARSRNDQIATDVRMLVRDACEMIVGDIIDLKEALAELAKRHRDVIMPGYTHLQRAQPILFAHHLLAYFEMLDRDEIRFWDCRERLNVNPLGSGALAGVPYPIDRDYTTQQLAFDTAAANSIDAVSDRDFVVEFQSCAAITMMHCSRLAEELVLWSSAEFGYITLDDAFATGSSIMPQKKNPDIAELARGRSGRVFGNLMGILSTLKGLPLSYNRDLQEDRQGFLSTLMTLSTTLQIFAEMIPTITVNAERMERAATANYALATDIADYLAHKGIPFREAHEAVGRLVRYAETEGKDFPELTLEEYHRFSPQFDEDIFTIDARSAVAARNVYGGTAPSRVAEQLNEIEDRLEDSRRALEEPDLLGDLNLGVDKEDEDEEDE
ncbi:MAG: argininosuccinate lyase, partial [Dehalococcoidia bacterium]